MLQACGCCDNNEQADRVLIELVKPPPSVMIVAVFCYVPKNTYLCRHHVVMTVTLVFLF
jgi:hypothetical protein